MAKGQGRDGAGVVLLLTVLLFCFFAHSVTGAVFMVGDSAGWTFNVTGWPSTKRFQAGDQLLFSYTPPGHNVAQVDRAGHNACRAAAGSKVFTSGRDLITLSRGTSYFICTLPGHCEADMKIAVTAT